MPKANAVSIDEVIAAELDDIANRRGDAGASPANAANWEDECHKRRLFGLCLSGGGIRSATLALGVLQGLAERDLLPKVDYLSSVSGGGYAGSWLQGLLCRLNAGPHGYDVLKQREPGPPTRDPISFLRKYSDYLSPRTGLSLDAVVIPIIWIRNALLNQAIFASAFLAAFVALLVPPALVRFVAESNWISSLLFLMSSALFASVVVYWVQLNLARIAERQHGQVTTPLFPAGEGTERVGILVVIPLVIAVFLLVLSLLPPNAVLRNDRGAELGFVILWALLAGLQWGGGFIDCCVEQRKAKMPAQWLSDWNWLVPNTLRRDWDWLVPRLHILWMSFVTSVLVAYLFRELYGLIAYLGPEGTFGSSNTVAWIPPLYLAALMLGITLQIGLMGCDFPDASREWLARLGAFLWAVTFGWAAIFAIGLFSPFWIAKMWAATRPAIVSAAIVWVGTTVSSVFAGKSGKTGPEASSRPGFSVTLDVLARYGPVVAVPGILVALAFCLQLLLAIKSSGASNSSLADFVSCYWDRLPYEHKTWHYPEELLAGLCTVFILLSLRVNINEFSMHHFYKNRLVRCFLGASSAQKRKPDSFTGFDPQDDIPLCDLRCDKLGGTLAPYPILNATITVTAGSELATQERKALPWIFTPRYSGFDPRISAADTGAANIRPHLPGFADSGQILGGGVRLGTAMAISGAALNPSDGFHFAPQTAFLMTFFDVRLGWWVGNPRNGATYRRTGPRFALYWLLCELFGFVTDRTAYLNLSDGGNFENLGLYELVRRRCRYVIAVDAEQDPTYVFESLASAVRKCREDFGIEIDIDTRPIVPVQGLSVTHCVVGRIHYPETGSEPGWLLYIKASITGDEPADVEEYGRQHSDFPQQSTAEQFFLESQFESYRRLGAHVARTTFDSCNFVSDLDEAFVHLENRWCRLPKRPESYERHAAEYVRLIERLADSQNLGPLDSEILDHFPSGKASPPRIDSFFRIELLQFMENIFYDLGLASSHTWNHPANAGWKKTFEYWTSQQMMKELWHGQKLNYSKPFQDFLDNLMNRSKGPEPWQTV